MSSEIDGLTKDAFLLTSRLFDHSSFTRSECKLFVSEMETKRNKQGAKTFLDIIVATEKSRNKIPECVQLLDGQLERLHKHITGAASCGMDVLTASETKDEQLRSKHKANRDAEWNRFLDEMNQAKAEVIQKHEESLLQFSTKPTS